MGSVSKGSDSIDYQRGQTRLIGDRLSKGSYQGIKGADTIDYQRGQGIKGVRLD